MKICPTCNNTNILDSAKVCPYCFYNFPEKRVVAEQSEMIRPTTKAVDKTVISKPERVSKQDFDWNQKKESNIEDPTRQIIEQWSMWN